MKNRNEPAKHKGGFTTSGISHDGYEPVVGDLQKYFIDLAFPPEIEVKFVYGKRAKSGKRVRTANLEISSRSLRFRLKAFAM
jgi:hypothetical protein